MTSDPSTAQGDGPQTMRFVRKRACVDAVCWDGRPETVESFVGGCRGERWDWGERGGVMIRSLSGWHCASLGDWIIRGDDGTLWCCEGAAFAVLYEPADATMKEGGHGG